MTKTNLITMGCRLNAFETEVMRDHLQSASLENTILVNSCAVTREAVRQTRQIARKARRENPDAKIIVTGCAAQTETDSLAAMPEIDFILGNENKLKPETFVAIRNQSDAPRLQVSDIMTARAPHDHIVKRFNDRTRAHVQIQNGCDHRCTFCMIPFGRGPSRSVPAAHIIDQIKSLVGEGYQEVVLTGVDITAYGIDIDGTPQLGRIVQQILHQVPDLARLRLSSIDSVEVDRALFESVTGDIRLMPHLHLSLQAGDNLTLKRMKRRHTREDAIAFCRKVRDKRPDMVFGADLIAGFPTESEEMFANTVNLIDECDLTRLHIFPFSPRPGTPAALMPQLDGDVVKQRAKILRTKGAEKLEQQLNTNIGQQHPVLVETGLTGRTPHFAVARFKQAQKPGDIVKAEIISQSNGELHARPAL